MSKVFAIAQSFLEERLLVQADVQSVAHVAPRFGERREDVPALSQFFLEKMCKKMAVRARFGDGVTEFLESYGYPGNIRELENMIAQGVALASLSGVIELEDILPPDLLPPARDRPGDRSLAARVDAAERASIEAALLSRTGNCDFSTQ